MIGKLRHSVIISEPTTTFDDTGGQVNTFSELITTRAHVKKENVRRVLESGSIVEETQAVFTIRYRADLTISRGCTIRYDGKDYLVHAVKEVDERNRYLKLYAHGTT